MTIAALPVSLPAIDCLRHPYSPSRDLRRNSFEETVPEASEAFWNCPGFGEGQARQMQVGPRIVFDVDPGP